MVERKLKCLTIIINEQYLKFEKKILGKEEERDRLVHMFIL